MFCLNCGTKVNEEEQDACENCGMTLAEMRERIARAEEMITYADTVGPSATEKLPPVKQRQYKDMDGNPLNPEKSIEFEAVAQTAKAVDLSDLPQIASEDPYITMPIQKIVSESGKVVLDHDTELRTYIQPEPKKKSALPIAIGIIVILLVIIAVLGYMLFTK